MRREAAQYGKPRTSRQWRGTIGGDHRVWKRAAASAAVATVPDGTYLGLGSGTTAELMLEELARRVRAGLRMMGVPTSERTRALAARMVFRWPDWMTCRDWI